jgi:hypothetical protein
MQVAAQRIAGRHCHLKQQGFHILKPACVSRGRGNRYAAASVFALATTLTCKWDDISDDGVWTINTELREKGNAGQLRLPPVALEHHRGTAGYW